MTPLTCINEGLYLKGDFNINATRCFLELQTNEPH